MLLGVFAVLVALLAGLTLRQDSANALDLSSANGTWGAIVVSNDASCVAGVGTNEIRWGDAGESCGALTDRSGYRWDGGAAVAPITPGASFLLGKFTHFNHPIDSGGAPSTVPLALPLVFANPAQNVNLNVDFGHHETPNGANPCAYTGAGIDNSNGCADRVQLPNIGDQQFTVGGTTYILEFTGFRPLAGETCDAADPGGASVDTFYTKEDAVNRACIYAKLTEVRTIRVIKLADGSNTGTFSGTIAPGGPTTADDAFSVTLTGSGNSAADVNTVTTDAQVITETTLPANWSLVGYYFHEDPDGNYSCSGSESYTKDGNGATTVPGDTNSYTVCIKNTKAAASTPKLTIVKDVISGTGQDPQDFEFKVRKSASGTDPLIATVTLDDDNDPALPNNATVDLDPIDGSEDYYTVTETAVANWDLDSESCSGAAGSGWWWFDSSWRFYVKIDANHMNPTCTFKNKYERAKILVKKVVTGTGADANQLFTATINNTDGSSGDLLTPFNFGQNSSYTHSWDEGSDDDDDFEVIEGTAPANWQVTGKWVSAGNQSCPGAADGSWVTTTPGTASGGALNDLENGDVVTVCFRNTYSPPTRTIDVCKIVVGNGDGVTDGGEFLFGSHGNAATLKLSATEPAGDATDGTPGTKVCGKLTVAPGDTGVFEWGDSTNWRPGLDGLTGTWNTDDAQYPKGTQGSVDNCTGPKTGTVNITANTNEVTFCNKTLPRTRQITVEKHFIGTVGYAPQAGDYPTIQLSDPTGTSCVGPTVVGQHLEWTCTVPNDWNGTVTETPAAGWVQVSGSVGDNPPKTCELPPSENRINQVTAEPKTSWVFCNQPYGTLVINKLNTSASGPNFTATISGGAFPGNDVLGGALSTSETIANSSPSTQTHVPLKLDPISVTEVNAGTAETCGSGATNYVTIVQAPADKVLDTPGEIQEWTIVNQPCGVLGQGGLVLAKYRDNNGDGTANGSDAYEPWTIKVTGPGGYDQTFVLTAAQMPFLVGPLAPGNYTVSELTQAGWKVVGLRVDNGALVANASQTTVAVDGGTNVLRGVVFYNQPRVNIEVNKTEISLATPAGAPGNGWSFTLTGCGIIPQVKATDATGKATFTDLPPAVACSYTVTETVKSGWSAINPVQVTAPATAGQTAVLGFTNVKIEVCIDCRTVETPTPTPTPETPTPETPTPETPTPETPTKPDEPVDDVEGEKTPGPQTPIAPSTGNGLMGSGPGGVNMLMALVGLLAISLGSTILALGRKSSRR
ncbi:MAG: THxN family PEP-CTERM protein [Acidobacteria bacterium]|nr:THxN family PEP-CTERM protein [Acidobacteriota bacterium]